MLSNACMGKNRTQLPPSNLRCYATRSLPHPSPSRVRMSLLIVPKDRRRHLLIKNLNQSSYGWIQHDG